VRTVISAGTQEVPVNIKRGVKQGSLSPFIFNALMEPLILDLEKRKGFQINSECTVSSVAFADDIILLALGDEEAKSLLTTTAIPGRFAYEDLSAKTHGLSEPHD
jgi:hypothetical protein